MMQDILLPVLCILIPCLGVGAFISQILQKQFAQRNLAEFLSVSFLIGAGVVTLLQFVLLLVGVRTFWSLMLFNVVGYVLLTRICLKYALHREINFEKKHLLATVIILLFLITSFARSFSRVMYTWDATAFWIPKMFAIWQMPRMTPEALVNFNHPEYPLLLPTIGANAFVLFGFPNEVAVKVAIFGFTVSLLILMNQYLLKILPWSKAAFWLVLFLSLFIVREHVAGEYVGTADILVGTYIVAGAIQFLQKRKLLAVVLWCFTAWAKSEGLVWAATTTGLLCVHEIISLHLYKVKAQQWVKKLIQTDVWRYIGIGTVLVLPWFVFNKLGKLDASQYFKFKEIYARPWVEYAVYSVHAFREEFRNIEKWNLLFFVFLLKSLLEMKRIVQDKKLLIVYLALIAQVCMYLVIFTITPEEQATFIAAAISRLTLHFAPVVLILSAALFSDTYKTQKI